MSETNTPRQVPPPPSVTEPTSCGAHSIAHVQVVIYAWGDAGEQDRAIAVCEQWAAVHDWHVATVVRETSDYELPLDRVGIRTVLEHLDARRGTVALAASRRQVTDDPSAFHEVCRLAERTGGFWHVLGDSRETPRDRSPADRERRDALHDVPGTHPDTGSQAPPDRRLAYLQALGRAIDEATDLEVALIRLPVSSALALHVVSPHPGHLNDDITCVFRSGTWWFLWSWGTTLGPAEDVDAAVAAIRHVLAPGSEG